jgi:hypothetical protein
VAELRAPLLLLTAAASSNRPHVDSSPPPPLLLPAPAQCTQQNKKAICKKERNARGATLRAGKHRLTVCEGQSQDCGFASGYVTLNATHVVQQWRV